MNIKTIGTPRLLKLYRCLRKSMFTSSYYWFDDDWREVFDEESYYADRELLEAMKAELDTREHVPRQRCFAKKQKRKLLFKH